MILDLSVARTVNHLSPFTSAFRRQSFLFAMSISCYLIRLPLVFLPILYAQLCNPVVRIFEVELLRKSNKTHQLAGQATAVSSPAGSGTNLRAN